MNDEPTALSFIVSTDHPRMREAIAEMQSLILRHFPEATFDIGEGDDPEGAYLWTTVDLVDTDPVIDLVVSHLNDLLIDERMALYVFPLRTQRREAELRRDLHAQRSVAAIAL